MNKTVITSVILLLLAAVPISVCVVKHPDVIKMERRKINPFPQCPDSLAANKVKRFFKEFESYYNDRILGRSAFLRLSNKIYAQGKADQNPNKCYRGKEDWLFLGNDYDRCVDALTGVWTPSAQQRSNQIKFFTEVEKTVRACGAEFHMLIGPNKSTIYPEYLPPLTFPAKKRCISPAVEALKAKGISIFDSAETLLKNKDKGLLYYRSDTHWNHLGAKIAFEAFLNQTEVGKLPPVNLVPQKEHRGDLVNIGGYKKFPLKKGDNFAPRWVDSANKASSDKTVLVLGDSFSDALMYYLEGMYKDVHRIHYDKLVIRSTDMPKLTKYIQEMKKKPDIVLWVQVERIFAHWGTR